MELILKATLAFTPVLLAIILLLGFRLSAQIVMPLVLLVTIIIAFVVWEVDSLVIIASTIQGLFITLDILYIILGAILLLSVLKYSGGLSSVQYHFTRINSDRRIQIIIIGWLFGSFLEGAAGFGTPAAIVAPLMVALGFPAMASIVVGLMVQSTPVTFGAIGTPILIGVNNGLADGILTTGDKAIFLQSITSQISIIHAIVGTFIPWFMIVMIIFFFGEKRDRKKSLTIAPFAIFSGLAFTVPYTLTAIFLGPEFPSLFGAMMGLFIVMLALKYKVLIPKDTWDFTEKQNWPSEWSGQIKVELQPKTTKHLSVFKTFTPYFLVSLLLIITRKQELGIGTYLRTFEVSWPSILDTPISASSTPLYLPGTMLLIASIAAVFVYKMRMKNFKKAFKDAFQTSFMAAFVLMFTIPMVRIYINSGINSSGLESMPVVLAQWVAGQTATIWPLIAPFVGALGAFIAGSNTVSNLMFSAFQYSVATELGLSNVVVVSLQAVGAAAGNMIAIHNIVAASAVVGLIGKEGNILRKTIIPTLYYLIATGILGMVLTKLFF